MDSTVGIINDLDPDQDTSKPLRTKPHVAQYVSQIATPLLARHNRGWCIKRLESLIPMYLYGGGTISDRGALIDMYDHVRVEISGFGGQEDYDLLEELVRRVRMKYERDYCQWFYEMHPPESCVFCAPSTLNGAK